MQIIHMMATAEDHKRSTRSNQNTSGTLRIKGLKHEDRRLNGR